jgi:predicted PurR-regulated permease PerM
MTTVKFLRQCVYAKITNYVIPQLALLSFNSIIVLSIVYIYFCPFVPFLLAIVLSVLLRYTDSE